MTYNHAAHGLGLQLPDGGATLFRAHGLHRAGATGRGVRVVVIDTGVAILPYFEERGYRLRGARTNRAEHGTGMAAVFLSVAPDVELWSVCLESLRDGSATLAELPAPDLVLCCWATPSSERLVAQLIPVAHRIVAPTQPSHSVLASCLDGVRVAALQSGARLWLPDRSAHWTGPSAITAGFAGLVAVHLSDGLPWSRAVDAATEITAHLLASSTVEPLGSTP